MKKILNVLLKVISQVFLRKNNIDPFLKPAEENTCHIEIKKNETKKVPEPLLEPTQELDSKQILEKADKLVENIKVVDDVVEQLLFIKGVPNSATDEITIKLRQNIKYEFGHKSDGLVLQCVEYVQYKVKKILGVDIKWPADRPRDGGKWAAIFEKNKLYKVLDDPKKYCAASFANPLFNPPWGHVAFVEEVFNDGSIKISEVNWPSKGIYNERIIKRDVWQDKYGCRFIDFS